MLHIPILRKGAPYKSLDVVTIPHHRTRQPLVEISQANAGLIRRDLLPQHQSKQALQKFSTQELIAMSARAAEYFLNDSLPLGDCVQSPQDYVEQLSATTGMPFVFVRKNRQKIFAALTEMQSVLDGLTRGLDLQILDSGAGTHAGHSLSFYPRGDTLGIVLPSNSPGVHSLWVPAIALKTALVLKPGAAEPWTPYRLIQAFIKAGVPREAFYYYPTSHVGASEILRNTGRGMMFGDVAAVGKYKNDSRIELHGPGYSKVVIADDCINDWEKYLDVMVTSILENGGRSCLNASGIWVTSHAEEIAEALAERLASVVPRDADDEQAQIAPFADGNVAERISAMIDAGLADDGATEVTAKFRNTERLATHQGCTYLLPTVVRCDSPEHTLANKEFLFPFASVVNVKQDEIPERLGKTLVVTAITKDEKLIERLVSSPLVDRLNIGAIPTMQIGWDQPHEGNLFEHLYARRAFQRASA
ncbi:MAG: aldehyde dehydrogenase family protein [Acidobacteria bacterium]|nr:aldehyde dehydrogenase family protein [Acidobacteriota bacterium]